MPAPGFVTQLLGWRGDAPNTADRDSAASVRIATRILETLGIPTSFTGPDGEPGAALEAAVKQALDSELTARVPGRVWTVERHRLITDFDQYSHLGRIQAIIDADETKTLGAEIGRDYLIKPDVTVGVSMPGAQMALLHAAVSCKWTIRSDRVQNIRHEAVILTRHRRGRQPHIVSVTAEPLPTRLASIARGTGEVDGVYHVALEELIEATNEVGTQQQKDVLQELVSQKRLAGFDQLLEVLAF